MAEGRSGSLSYWLEGKSYYLVYQPVGFQHLSIVGIVGRGVVDSGMRKIQNATILLLAGLFFCAGIVLVHGVRTDAACAWRKRSAPSGRKGRPASRWRTWPTPTA